MRVAFPPVEMTAVEDRSRSTDPQESGDDGKRDIDASDGTLLPGITAQFASHISADDVSAAIQRFEDRLRKVRPDGKYICVEPIPRQAQRSEPTPVAR